MPARLWADTDSHGLHQLSLEPRNRAGHRERNRDGAGTRAASWGGCGRHLGWVLMARDLPVQGYGVEEERQGWGLGQ